MLAGVVVSCATTGTNQTRFEASLASFSLHMQSAAKAASGRNAERTVSEFTLACAELRSAEAAAPKDELMLVGVMATQCNVVLAQFAMGEMESAMVLLDDLAWMASRLGPLDDELANPQWMRCAVYLTVLHRGKCSPACAFPKHYGPLLNDVAERCGGSDVQLGGGRLLTQLWREATARTLAP